MADDRAPAPCEWCGAPAGLGGERYSHRPARFCSHRCRSAFHDYAKRGKTRDDVRRDLEVRLARLGRR